MADWAEGQDRDESTCTKSRNSRSPSPVLIYPPPQHFPEYAALSSPFFQSPTLLREPFRSSTAKVEVSSSLSTPCARTNPGTSETNSQPPALLREPHRSLSAKVETPAFNNAVESLEMLNINSEVQSTSSTDVSLQPASKPEAHLPLHKPSPLTAEPQVFVRSESPIPPPVPPLPSSYLTISSPVSSSMSPSEQAPEEPMISPTKGRFFCNMFKALS